MKIDQIKLKGYRNFKDATVNFSEKTLIIGANDVGKSNLLHAMRLLLDRSISDWDTEPVDSDFYCHEETSELSITIKFSEVNEESVIARLPGKISDQKELFISYQANKKNKTYKFLLGPKENLLEEIQERYYRKAVHLKYISSNRDLYDYIRREKRNLLKEAQEKRSESEIKSDNKSFTEIEKNLIDANDKISKLSYVSKSTEAINAELEKLSFHHTGQEVIFDVGTSDLDSFIGNLQLASRANNSNLLIGGDGRNNQIFLALWAARNEIKEENPLEVVFYCIEEPEAHLHPHQQRKLAEYLINTLKGQVFITTHSPQIASEFSANSIVRLLVDQKSTIAASDGCSKIISDSITNFGHRLNIIASEAFFANAVLLVEGQSEILFYKVLARELGIDLDRLNISILMADGIGFKVFVEILQALGIEWVLRTDNDVFKIPKKNEYRLAGVQRAVEIYKNCCSSDSNFDIFLAANEKYLTGFANEAVPSSIKSKADEITSKLSNFDIFVSDKDLENDLLNEEIGPRIVTFLKVQDREEALSIMEKRKATFMYHFLKEHSKELKKLNKSNLALPLLACKRLIEG